MPGSGARTLDDIHQEALAAARGLERGETALAGVLRDLEQERSRAAQAYHAVVRSLAAALEARDGYTGEHSDDVHDLAVSVASRLGLDARGVAEVQAVALLHDIGKIGVPDQVLHKPGPLDADEWALMRQHPVIGERILRPLPGFGAIATAVRHEHERWDGGGYPDGLAGDAIPLASRIVLACDAHNALVSDRPYRAAMSAEHARDELRAGAGTQFDPEVVEVLLACLADPLERPDGPGAEDVARALTEPGAGGQEQRLERELHALIAIASAVGAAHRLEDVAEVAAEQACTAVGATSLSLSRWEVQGRVLRTLINVGELGPGEERLPVDEVYRLDGDDVLRRLLERGDTYRMSLGDPDIHPAQHELLTRLDREHCVGVPVTFAGAPWGELWASRAAGCEPFSDRDERFLQTVAGQIAAAVGRAELFSRMADLALQDPLTGVANRRALDERLELAVADARDGDDVTVLLCDVDNLKELNDAHGHQAGDAALAAVAAVLGDEAGDALVARVGGDEFCVLLEGEDAETGRMLGERVLVRLAARDDLGLSVSCGVASTGAGSRRAGDLLRAADAAQYTAKRSGRARVCVADHDLDLAWRSSSSERRAIRGRDNHGTVDAGALLASALDALDGPLAGRSALDRLEGVAMSVGSALDASAAAVSWLPAGGDVIETLFVTDWRTSRTAARRFGAGGEAFDAAAYPATAGLLAAGGAFVVHVDDPAADAAERALIAEYGMAGVLAGGTLDAGGAWLVEVYADGRSRELGDAEPALRLLMGEAVRGATAAPLAPAADAPVLTIR